MPQAGQAPCTLTDARAVFSCAATGVASEGVEVTLDLELLVIRLKHAPSQSAIDALNQDFAGIITGEKIQSIEPTPEEREDKAYLDLPRIAFGFNRRDYGRLRQMIDVLNSF